MDIQRGLLDQLLCGTGPAGQPGHGSTSSAHNPGGDTAANRSAAFALEQPMLNLSLESPCRKKKRTRKPRNRNANAINDLGFDPEPEADPDPDPDPLTNRDPEEQCGAAQSLGFEDAGSRRLSDVNFLNIANRPCQGPSQIENFGRPDLHTNPQLRAFYEHFYRALYLYPETHDQLLSRVKLLLTIREYEQSQRQANEQSPRKTNEQSPHLTNEQSPHLTNEQSPHLTNEQSPHLTNEQFPHRTNEQSLRETNEQSLRESNEQSPRETEREVVEEPQKPPPEKRQTAVLVAKLFNENKPLNILDLQTIFFKYVNNSKPIDDVKKRDVSKKQFPNYYTKEEVDIGIQNGTIFVGAMRVKNGKMSYVTSPEYGEDDIQIEGWKNRNRALDSDIVAVELGDDLNGRVVHILQQNHPRKCIGSIKKDYMGKTFYPRDGKIPRMTVSNYGSFRHDENDPHVYYVEIIKYEVKEPECKILKDIGSYSDFMTQYQSILFENSLDLKPILMDHFMTHVIPLSEYETRADFRKTCVFTIDPATARDLDDAVSCTMLKSGNYEIGVHISDVTYYLKENTVLDQKVSEKATTIYLTDKTYHMLPDQMCLLCSLLPGIDKLTYSVIWEITKDGKILNHRFTRSIINSCCQLSYDHAQKLIEKPNRQLNQYEFPRVKNGFTLNDVKLVIRALHQLAKIFKKRRLDGGCLRIDQPKINFNLNSPLSFEVEVLKESNSLIEEFMLLANQTVAKRIYNDFPNIAFLRKHTKPKNNLKRLVNKLKVNGVYLDTSSASGLQATLSSCNLNNKKEKMKYHVLQRNLVKTLSRAEYFCASTDPITLTYAITHYALNMDLYTHFTSPIRRYADIMVHRLLSASLGYSPKPTWTEKYVQTIADTCNTKKSSAKNAGDMSIKLYFLKYVSINSPLFYEASIVDIFETGIEIIIPDAGFSNKITYDEFSEDMYALRFKKGDEKITPDTVRVDWSCGPQRATQILKIFSIVNVVLKKTVDIMKLDIYVLSPFNNPNNR